MPLTLRHTGLSSQVYRDQLDYTIFEDGRPIGRMYEDASAATPAELRWFWSITVYVPPALGIKTHSRTAAIEEAKAEFRAAWEKCCSAGA